MPRPNYAGMSSKALAAELRKRDHQVRRRGFTIGGLYAALQYALEGNPLTYQTSYTTGGTPTEMEGQLKRELTSAREHVKSLIKNARQKKEEEEDEMSVVKVHEREKESTPEESYEKLGDFGCNICFEKYDDEKIRPIALGCGHLLCNSCYIAKNTKDTGKIPTCPTCRADIQTMLPLFVSLIE